MRRIVFCLMGLALPGLAAAEQPAEKPMLVLDAGGHTDSVPRALFTPDGKQVISVSKDKTIRVWDAESGELLRTLRPPAGAGRLGTLYGVALSPDGRTLAVGGIGSRPDEFPIYLITLATGQIDGVLKGHTATLVDLAFSPDGKFLASASEDKTARVWDLAIPRGVTTLEGHKHSVYGVAFAPDGRRLATASLDGTARLWSLPSGNAEAVLKDAFKDQFYAVHSVAWSPDGKTVATGSWDRCLRLWNVNGTLRERYGPFDDTIRSVAFTPDSKQAILAQGFDYGKGCIVIGLADGKERLRFTKHQNGAWYTTTSGRGDLAVSTGFLGKDLYLWRVENGALVHQLKGRGSAAWSVAWSADGKAIAWGDDGQRSSNNAAYPLDYTFLPGELVRGPKPDGGFARGYEKRGSLSLERVRGQDAVLVKEGDQTISTLRLTNNPPTCYALLPGDRAVVGSYFGLYLFDARSGKQLRSFQGHTGNLAAVTPSPDGRYLLSASADHTLRIWTLDRDEPLLSFFFAGDDWVAWTPEGYYAASPGGEQLMGWQVNNGPDKMASYYPASQFRKTLYRPDVIKRLLSAGSVEKALADADEERGKASRQTEVAQVLPPKVSITSPKAGGLRTDKAALHVEAHAVGTENNPVASLRLLLDGRPIAGGGPKVFTRPIANDARLTWDVDLPPGSHRLAVQATGTASVGLSDELEVMYTPAGQAPDKAGAAAGGLYVLAVGINDYPGALKLQCAAPDARLIAQTFKDQGKGLFRTVEVRLLTDRDATRSGILKGLQWLRDNAKPGDVAVAFYAGHGDCRIARRFFLIPVDADLKDLPATGVSGDELKAGLGDLPCSTVLLLDACYSGSIDARRKKRALPGAADALVRDFAYDAGLVVMCGASKEQEAAEEEGHGFFTKALAEGLSGKAAKDRQGLVTLYKLQDYVHDRVEELSGGEQEPTVSIPSTVRSFPLAKP